MRTIPKHGDLLFPLAGKRSLPGKEDRSLGKMDLSEKRRQLEELIGTTVDPNTPAEDIETTLQTILASFSVSQEQAPVLASPTPVTGGGRPEYETLREIRTAVSTAQRTNPQATFQGESLRRASGVAPIECAIAIPPVNVQPTTISPRTQVLGLPPIQPSTRLPSPTTSPSPTPGTISEIPTISPPTRLPPTTISPPTRLPPTTISPPTRLPPTTTRTQVLGLPPIQPSTRSPPRTTSTVIPLPPVRTTSPLVPIVPLTSPTTAALPSRVTTVEPPSVQRTTPISGGGRIPSPIAPTSVPSSGIAAPVSSASITRSPPRTVGSTIGTGSPIVTPTTVLGRTPTIARPEVAIKPLAEAPLPIIGRPTPLVPVVAPSTAALPSRVSSITTITPQRPPTTIPSTVGTGTAANVFSEIDWSKVVEGRGGYTMDQLRTFSRRAGVPTPSKDTKAVLANRLRTSARSQGFLV